MVGAPPPGAAVHRGTEPTVQRRPYLYVGNLSLEVTEGTLRELFAQAGTVRSTKIVAPSQGHQRGGTLYGFVEYARLSSAESALNAFQGFHLLGRELRLNWARQGAGAGEPVAVDVRQARNQSLQILTSHRPEEHFVEHHRHSAAAVSRLYVIFVGDLAPEIDEGALKQAFAIFPSLHDARIMWDLQSHRSRGFGFVRFTNEKDASSSIRTMTGQWLGSRAIRVNWACRRSEYEQMDVHLPGALTPPSPGRKNLVAPSSAPAAPQKSAVAAGHVFEQTPFGCISPGLLSEWDDMLAEHSAGGMEPIQRPTFYLGNVSPLTQLNDLIHAFELFGSVVYAQLVPERNGALIMLGSSAAAAIAIASLSEHPMVLDGRAVRVERIH
ncbi:E3 ubiquitin-protein ligase pub1 [Malassezia sp. CBS 17886]|nr:E3 ubiquitin-protein ligase pub1 [Malassezia sp. CBS 17886]